MTRHNSSRDQPVYEYKAVPTPRPMAPEDSSGPSKLPSDASEGQSFGLSSAAKFRFRSLPLKLLDNVILNFAGADDNLSNQVHNGLMKCILLKISYYNYQESLLICNVKSNHT